MHISYIYTHTEYDGLVSNIFHFHPGKCNDAFLNHKLALYLEGSEGTTSEGESNYVKHEAFRCSVICHWKKMKNVTSTAKHFILCFSARVRMIYEILNVRRLAKNAKTRVSSWLAFRVHLKIPPTFHCFRMLSGCGDWTPTPPRLFGEAYASAPPCSCGAAAQIGGDRMGAWSPCCIACIAKASVDVSWLYHTLSPVSPKSSWISLSLLGSPIATQFQTCNTCGTCPIRGCRWSDSNCSAAGASDHCHLASSFVNTSKGLSWTRHFELGKDGEDEVSNKCFLCFFCRTHSRCRRTIHHDESQWDTGIDCWDEVWLVVSISSVEKSKHIWDGPQWPNDVEGWQWCSNDVTSPQESRRWPRH